MTKVAEIHITQAEAKTLANNLQALLKAKKVSEGEVASSINMPVMTVRRIVSGETSDPRISTIKLLADYFKVTIDDLLCDEEGRFQTIRVQSTPRCLPILDWSLIADNSTLQNINLDSWSRWQPIATSDKNTLSDLAFALESRPSMQPRYPIGTLFIIDPKEEPLDGDVILIKLKDSNQLSLRELIIDPPKWQLQPIVSGSEIIFYEKEKMEIVGVVVLTLLLNRKERK